jgi:hypothetical protein
MDWGETSLCTFVILPRTGLNALVSEVIERLEAQQAEVEAAAAQANTGHAGKGSDKGLQRRLPPGAKGLPSGDKCSLS